MPPRTRPKAQYIFGLASTNIFYDNFTIDLHYFFLYSSYLENMYLLNVKISIFYILKLYTRQELMDCVVNYIRLTINKHALKVKKTCNLTT